MISDTLDNVLAIIPQSGATQLGAGYADLATIIAQAPGYLDKVIAIVGKAGPYLDTIQHVAEDPALPRFVERVKTLRAMQAPSTAPPSPEGVQAAGPPGVGLESFIAPLDWYIWMRSHPVAPWLIGGGVIATFLGLGFTAGYLVKRRRGCAKSAGLARRRRRR